MTVDFEQVLCPISSHDDVITLAHGSGGRKSAQLLNDVILKHLRSEYLAPLQDSASIPVRGTSLAFTTDSYVIDPLFFPGGDIGQLAVIGTVNDLSMSGARPLYISLGLIIEEGFPIDTLSRIVKSIADTANRCDVQVVTGDTKVVNAGKADGIFINTAGVGSIDHPRPPATDRIAVGDAIICSGDIGRHGCSVMAQREEYDFATSIKSDLAPLHLIVEELLSANIDIHCLRDLTRGGLAGCAIELASSSRTRFELQQEHIPVSTEVRSLSSILGLDELYIANEGCMLTVLPQTDVNQALAIMHRHPQTKLACVIGEVTEGPGDCVLVTPFNTKRKLEQLTGEMLPRIC